MKGKVVQDSEKQFWIIGDLITSSGNGDIYLAASSDGSEAIDDYSSLVKIEREKNDLSFEIYCYTYQIKRSDVTTWTKIRKLKWLGIPKFVSAGKFDNEGVKLNFIVLGLFGSNLSDLFTDNNRIIPVNTVYKIAQQVVEVLSFIHGKGLIHGDVKLQNLHLDLKSANRVNVVDLGFACPVWNSLGEDSLKENVGTLEYMSRDAHKGVLTMRGDFEVLGYNLIHWLGGHLPWEGIDDTKRVQFLKEQAFAELTVFFDFCFQVPVLEALSDYFQQVKGMQSEDVPDYVKFRNILRKALTKLGDKADTLEFNSSAQGADTSTTTLYSTSVKCTSTSVTNASTCTDDLLDDGNIELDVNWRKLLAHIGDNEECEVAIKITKRSVPVSSTPNVSFIGKTSSFNNKHLPTLDFSLPGTSGVKRKSSQDEQATSQKCIMFGPLSKKSNNADGSVQRAESCDTEYESKSNGEEKTSLSTSLPFSLRKSPLGTSRQSDRNKLMNKDTEKGWQVACQQLLESMLVSADSVPFRKPVTSASVPQYYEIIKNPMDLRTVKEGLSGDNYKTPSEFARDVKLMFNNSRTICTDKSSKVYGMTNRLSTFFEEQMSKITAKYKESATPEQPKNSELDSQEATTTDTVTEDSATSGWNDTVSNASVSPILSPAFRQTKVARKKPTRSCFLTGLAIQQRRLSNNNKLDETCNSFQQALDNQNSASSGIDSFGTTTLDTSASSNKSASSPALTRLQARTRGILTAAQLSKNKRNSGDDWRSKLNLDDESD